MKKEARERTKAPRTEKRKPGEPAPNPAWFKPVMFGLMLLGLAWIIVYYLTSNSIRLPIPALGTWNILVGFGISMIGFLMTTRWR